MKRKYHKSLAVLSAVLLFAGMSVNVLAASEGAKTGWQDSPETKDENQGLLDEAQTEIGLNGYVGNVSPDAPGIDIDGDGKVDYVVEQDKIIEASVPAEVGVVAAGNGNGADFKVNFICPTIAIVNENEKKPIQVSITNAKVTKGNLLLQSFEKVSASNELGLKIEPVNKQDFAGQDVTTLENLPLIVKERLTGAVGYTLGAKYTEAMLDTHANTDEDRPEITINYGLKLAS